MLSLDDQRWKDLNHRNWINGAASHWSPDAPFVPDELKQLFKNPSDIERFHNLWPYLCSEGTAWPAAYAAVPHIVELAKQVPPGQRFEYLYFIGLVVMCTEDASEIRPELVESYDNALREALPLLNETLLCRHGTMDTRYLLAAVAALKGHPKLANVLNDMDCISEDCPKCGESVYPQELQDAAQ
jgi:hypothetical protein